MQVTLDALFGAPDLHFFAFEGAEAVFLPMDRAAYRRSIFLDGRISPAQPQMIKVPLAPLVQRAAARAPQRTGWIFHVAQCGSTLLARALDRDDSDLVLREPTPLRQLGVEAAAGRADAAWRGRLRLAAALAGRRWRADAPVIVKATVPVNFMLPELAALDPHAPAVFLYFPLEPYLLAVLRGPGHRQWVQRVTGELAPALAGEAGDMAGLADCERAAALWLAQMRAFAAAMEMLPNSHSLDAEALFGDPRPAIAAASQLFGCPMSDAELDAVLASDLFTTYSKRPAIAFDNDARVARQAEVARALAPELAQARAWRAPRRAAPPRPERQARPLTGDAPALL